MSERFRPGDVLVYTPREHHCLEGMAYVRDDGRAVDTFWAPAGDGQSHVLTEDEEATATVRFNVADFDAFDRWDRASRPKWEKYHPDDRARITMQHGLQEVLFVRKGATPDLATQIENARVRVAEAEADRDHAERKLELRRGELNELLASPTPPVEDGGTR